MRRRVLRRAALVDTSAFYALVDEHEDVHSAAITIKARLVHERWRLYTTNVLLAEFHALALRRFGSHRALTVLRDVDESATTIVRVSRADEQRAREVHQRFDDKSFSLADVLSFVIMERVGIPFAFTFDDNFVQYGLAVLTTS